MKKLLNCRRSMIAIIGMILLTYIAIHNGTDVALAITGIVTSICGANAYQSSVEARAKSTTTTKEEQ